MGRQACRAPGCWAAHCALPLPARCARCRLVVHIAKKYANQGVPLSDLIAEGELGLRKVWGRGRAF